MRDTLPYGSWPSPLTAAAAAAAAPRLEGAVFVGDDIWWGEAIAEEGSRTAVRRRTADGRIETLLPGPWSARSRVHEYGGGSWTASADGRLFFVEKTDQRVWMLAPRTGAAATAGADSASTPVPLTADAGDVRYGGLTWQHGRLLAVREDHTGGGVPRRAIVAISPTGDGATALVDGSDFLAQPSLSPDGHRLAWIAWNHPDMPWDRTEIRVADLRLDPPAVTTLPTRGSAPLQPTWTASDTLLYVDDTDGRWNLWRADGPFDDGDATTTTPLEKTDADTGGPLWVLGTRWFAPLADGRIVAIRTHGSDKTVVIAPDGSARVLDVPARSRTSIEDVSGTRVLISGAGAGVSGIWLVDVDGDTRLLRGGGPDGGPEWLPEGRAVTFPGAHGPVHAFDFPPTNPNVQAPEGELPPYLVWVHGGPTAHVSGVADTKVAYFTSRGIGVLDVNYGGSTGYGREYRERLRGQWGVVDVDDVIAAASGLAEEGRADGKRLAVEGGSAGGWTVLSALVRSDVFAAGISRYGVGDARALAADSHDFEARYLDGLIGPLPEAEQLYVERSPLTRADRFRVPLLLLQGADDTVVPPSQSEAIRDALAARGVPHAYVVYDGEGHGFRRPDTIVHALETELAFLGEVFGFETPGVPPLGVVSSADD